MSRDERNYSDKSTAKIRGTHTELAIGKIVPDPHNYNVLSGRKYAKLVVSIRRHGFIEPLVVRRINGKSGTTHETINGAHRLQAAKDVHLKKIPCIDMGKVSDTDSQEIAIILNELKGDPDQVRLADRIRTISESVSFDTMASVLPFTDNELKIYLKSMDFSFANMSIESQRPTLDEMEVAELPDDKRLTFKLPTKRADKVMAMLEKIDTDPSAAMEKAVIEMAQDKPEAKKKPKVAKTVRKGKKGGKK